jgi:phytol kinase
VWTAVGVFAAGILALIGTLTIVQKTTGLSPENVRKLFHLGGGAAALALPWLFQSLWPVLVLTGASLVLFLALRLVPRLREGPGQVLQSVTRQSVGEFSFLFGVLTVFAIASEDVVIYSIGILVLAVADTAAALIGVFYGRHGYEVPGGRKSAEGSSAFLLTAFLCVHVPLLLLTDIGRLESLLIAFNAAVLLMLAEADSARGIDNFVLPVMVVVLLKLFMNMSAAELGWNSVVITALGLLVFAYRNRTTLSPDALIGAALAGYVFWQFGGWRWLVPPLILFATYTRLVGRPQLESSRPFHAGVLVAIVAPGVVLATAHAVLRLPDLYGPYAAVWAANLAVIGMLHGWLANDARSGIRLLILNGARSLVVLVPALLIAGETRVWVVLAALGSVLLAQLIVVGSREQLTSDPTRPGSWARAAVSVGLGTLTGFALFGFGQGVLT